MVFPSFLVVPQVSVLDPYSLLAHLLVSEEDFFRISVDGGVDDVVLSTSRLTLSFLISCFNSAILAVN